LRCLKTNYCKEISTYKIDYFFLKNKQTPLLQNLFPEGFGPSSKICP